MHIRLGYKADRDADIEQLPLGSVEISVNSISVSSLLTWSPYNV